MGGTHADEAQLVEEALRALLPPFDPAAGVRTFGAGLTPWTLNEDVARARIAQLPATTVRAMIEVLPTLDAGRRDDIAKVCHHAFATMGVGLDRDWARWFMHHVANLLAFAPELGLLRMDHFERKRAMERALHLFEVGGDAPVWVSAPEPLPVDYLAADAAIRDDAAALLVASVLTGAADSGFPENERGWSLRAQRVQLPRPELVALARRHGAERVVRAAYARRTIDPSLLSGVLESEVEAAAV